MSCKAITQAGTVCRIKPVNGSCRVHGTKYVTGSKSKSSTTTKKVAAKRTTTKKATTKRVAPKRAATTRVSAKTSSHRQLSLLLGKSQDEPVKVTLPVGTLGESGHFPSDSVMKNWSTKDWSFMVSYNPEMFMFSGFTISGDDMFKVMIYPDGSGRDRYVWIDNAKLKEIPHPLVAQNSKELRRLLP